MGKVEGLFHHHKKDVNDDNSASKAQQQQNSSTEQPKKESEYDKFKDYMAEDKKLEQEGDEYGGLM